MIEFRTLGTLDLRRTDGTALASLLAQPKRIALLSYLCLATPRGFHRRDTILGMFWPDSDQPRARNSLRGALHVLRHAIGEDAFHSRGDEEIAANADAIWCDVVAFEERLAAKQFVEALELYRGELLPGFFLDEVPMFDRWLESERARLRSLAARAARLAAETRESDQNLTDAVHWARRAAELTDSDERAVRRLVELLARAGDRAGALQVYDDFVGRLASELEAEPSAETQALADRLRTARSAPESASAQPPAASTASGYRIEREIGRGGTAVVFLAGDLKHGRTVALKVLRPEIAAILGTQRFFAEISITARLNHPNIVTLLDSGEIDGAPFYSMPYVAGETLRARLRRGGALEIADAIRIVRDVAEALSYAHEHGVVHRDVKPENILFDNGRALVTDFGIARAISEATSQNLTQPGLAMGTAAYMSPEQADGAREVDARTDVYSLGCVLYEMLTGDPPFTGSSKHAILARKLAEPAPPLRNVRESVSPGLEQAVLRALARTPGDRFGTVKEFSDSLHASASGPRAVGDQGGGNGDANAAGGIGSPWSWFRSRRTAAAAAAVVAVAAAVVFLRSVASPLTLPPTERRKLTFTGMTTQGVLSPDGEFLAYVVQEVDSSRLILQDLTGGPPDTVLAFLKGTVDHYVEWSPDGARLLLRVRRGVLMVHRSGGQQDSVRSFRPGDRVNWLPDGRLSLFSLSAGRFLIVNPLTGDSSLIPIPAFHAASRDGAWSPDGRVFMTVIDSPDSARWGIRSVMLDGRFQVVVEDSVRLNSPRWSPSGDDLYYLRGDDAIWRVKVSTRTGKALSAPELVQTGIDALAGTTGVAHFSLSRDGRQLVYVKGEHYSNIYRVFPVDSNTPPRMERLTTGTALRWSPVVSPDGQWIAFAAQTKDGSELFRMPVAGGRAIPITAGAKVWPRSEIAWSPDGQYIAFQSVRANRSQVWIAAVSSGKLRRFEHTNATTRTGHLAWAPAPRIAYKIPRTFIRLLDPASAADELLVRDTADAWFHFQRYSPNGEEIAMARYHEPEMTLISILRVADRAETRLPTGPLFPRGWSADGRFIYAQVPARPILVRVDARGKKPPEAVFTAPVRDMECITGPARPRQSFICAMFDFTSDIWMIENFDRR